METAEGELYTRNRRHLLATPKTHLTSVSEGPERPEEEKNTQDSQEHWSPALQSHRCFSQIKMNNNVIHSGRVSKAAMRLKKFSLIASSLWIVSLFLSFFIGDD